MNYITNVGIYKITNVKNKKVYIGQSINLRKRIRDHKNELRKNKHRNVMLQRIYNKYGENIFVYEILEECEAEQLDSKEIFWIDFFGANDRIYGYNFESGGNRLKKHHEETITKISNSRKGKHSGKDHYLYGKKMTEENRIKLTLNKVPARGESHPMYGKFGVEHPTSKEVICINTKEVFGSGLEASRHYNIDSSAIIKCCRGKRNFCGKLDDGTKLKWMYLEKYKKIQVG